MLDVKQIMAALPHRYPFLLVDRLLELEPQKRVVGIKNVTINEQFFQGHYPGDPIMPGVLIIEAIAQVGGLSILCRDDMGPVTKIPLLGTIEDAKFRRPVVPGDQLRIEVDVIKFKLSVGKVSGKAYVGDDLCAEAILTFFLTDKVVEA